MLDKEIQQVEFTRGRSKTRSSSFAKRGQRVNTQGSLIELVKGFRCEGWRRASTRRINALIRARNSRIEKGLGK